MAEYQELDKVQEIWAYLQILKVLKTFYNLCALMTSIYGTAVTIKKSSIVNRLLTLILRRSRTGTVWFYTSTSKKRAARPKLYTKSLTMDLKRMYSRLTMVRISINL